MTKMSRVEFIKKEKGIQWQEDVMLVAKVHSQETM